MFRKYGWVIAVFIVAMFAWGAFSAEQASGADANEYVGDNEKKCGMCHKDQVAAWKKWPMAKTWDTLQASKDKKDSCIPCHVTGFGKPGGFVSIEKTPKLVNVQCEACHGPAKDHLAAPLNDVEKKRNTMTKPTEANCKTCHNKDSPHYKEFKYADAVKALADHKPKPKK
ncbi:cytochrome c family protein [bacterium]|nr:cytochrome c family protein [bacterium]